MSSADSGILSQTDKKKVQFDTSGSKRVYMRPSNSMQVLTPNLNDDMRPVSFPIVAASQTEFFAKDNSREDVSVKSNISRASL
jgi:hypothetical protein